MSVMKEVPTMLISSLGYNFVQGLKNVWRNKLFSLASIATMATCIFLFGVFYCLGMNFSSMVRAAEEGVAITVFFNEGISQAQVDAIGAEIGKRAEVSKYVYVSAEEAWESFKKDYFEGHEELADGFADDNPLANSANYQIYMNDVSMQSVLVSFLEGLDGVRQVNRSEAAAQTLSDFNKLLSVIMLAIIGLLLAVAIFLISNTIAVGIKVREDEIAIMKLIGAKDGFVRQPFIVEGLFIGLIGSGLPLLLIYVLYGQVTKAIATNYGVIGSSLVFIPQEEIFKILIPVALILGLGIGYIGSRITLHRRLKV